MCVSVQAAVQKGTIISSPSQRQAELNLFVHLIQQPPTTITHTLTHYINGAMADLHPQH